MSNIINRKSKILRDVCLLKRENNLLYSTLTNSNVYGPLNALPLNTAKVFFFNIYLQSTTLLPQDGFTNTQVII